MRGPLPIDLMMDDDDEDALLPSDKEEKQEYLNILRDLRFYGKSPLKPEAKKIFERGRRGRFVR